ncbi:MAG TPA: serine/threonine-protein kinase [Gemmatimonadales bacterium]|nr:serine/threonine-protein kinase [Gemmatimonadales bacterium]
MGADLTPERRLEIERLFEAALDRPADERRGFLAAACAGDAALLGEVGALLEAHALEEGILERDPVSALGPPPRDLRAGDTVGPYRIVREIGRGGMAVVYLAEGAERQVAVKLLHPGLTALLGRERFRREIRLAARLRHPGILPLLDSGEGDRGLWYSMPYIAGGTLRSRLREEARLSPPEAVRLAVATATALEYAHRLGVIHRDIKPENLLLDGTAVQVGDFGIGRVFDTANLDDTLTRTGVLIGTPTYMSPEQAAGERKLDGRTDVYGLGCVLYEMLVGEPPYPAPTPQAAIARHLKDPVPSPRRAVPEIPAALDAAVCRALAKSPAQRFTTAAAFAGALATALDPGGSRPWWRLRSR